MAAFCGNQVTHDRHGPTHGRFGCACRVRRFSLHQHIDVGAASVVPATLEPQGSTHDQFADNHFCGGDREIDESAENEAQENAFPLSLGVLPELQANGHIEPLS
jgi:hypothetical protein